MEASAGGPIRKSAWVAMVAAVLAINAPVVYAARQGTARNETAKGKAAPAQAKRTSSAQPQNSWINSSFPEPIDPFETRQRAVHRVRPGETLAQLLGRYPLSATEKQLWLRALTPHFGSRALPAGREVHFYFARSSVIRSKGPLGQLKAVEFNHNEGFTLVWEKGIKGIFFQRREKPYAVEIKSVAAEIDSSLFEDGRRAGVHPALLSQLLDIFAWDIDLSKVVGKGDTFRILYEQRSRKGQENRPTMRILAAELDSAGQKHTAVYFEKQQGQGNYYNLEGRSLARSFLRFPLEFTSITSHFADSRFHPILRTNLPHKGVDFAAQRGTPVRAVGDGIIGEAGWNGQYGKTIAIQHDGSVTSRYAHLHNFVSGIKSGMKVIKGQIIGYVGSTGRATGPHLHFELFKDQHYIDPLSADFPAEESVEPALLNIFETQIRSYLIELSALPATSSSPQS